MTQAQVADVLRQAGCVFAEAEAELLVAAPGPLEELLARRVAGEPLEQVLGWAEFDGLRVSVVPGVFVPRRRSELLVRLAAQRLAAPAVVLDLCCGSGALGMALRHRAPGIELYAVDLDPVAVACARGNLPGAFVSTGDLWGALPNRLRGRIRVIMANAPYVPSDRVAWMPTEARDHEPIAALDGGPDGLDLHRRVAAEASSWLEPGGLVLIEVAPDQSAAAAELLAAAGLMANVHTDDELDATAVIGVRPPTPANTGHPGERRDPRVEPGMTTATGMTTETGTTIGLG